MILFSTNEQFTFNNTHDMNAPLESHPIALDRRKPFLLPSRNRTTAGKRILVADDDAMVRGALAAVIESEGAVDEAGNGIETVIQAVEHSADLVLLDLNMPQLDGWRAFAHLGHVKPLVPVIVITARPHQYKEAVRLGVDAFMEKPLNIPVLLRAIKPGERNPGTTHEPGHQPWVRDPATFQREPVR